MLTSVGDARVITAPMKRTDLGTPSAKPRSGAWQEAQVDCPVPLRRGSKKSCLPSAARSGVSLLSSGEGTTAGSSQFARLGCPALSTRVSPFPSRTSPEEGSAARADSAANSSAASVKQSEFFTDDLPRPGGGVEVLSPGAARNASN